MRPGKITPKRFVPSHIVKPDWADSGIPTEEQKSRANKVIEVYTPGEIATDEIDQAVHRYIIDNGAYPSPLNYYNFRKSLCT